MEKFTPESIKALKAEIHETLKPLMEKYNIDIHIGGTTYNADHFTAKIEVNNLNKEIQDQKAKQLNDILKTYFDAKFEIGFEFESNGKKLRVVDVNLRARKSPIELLEVGTTTRYKSSVEFVNSKAILAADKAKSKTR